MKSRLKIGGFFASTVANNGFQLIFS